MLWIICNILSLFLLVSYPTAEKTRVLKNFSSSFTIKINNTHITIYFNTEFLKPSVLNLLIFWHFFFLSVLAESKSTMSRSIWLRKNMIVSYHLLVYFNKAKKTSFRLENLYNFQEAEI